AGAVLAAARTMLVAAGTLLAACGTMHAARCKLCIALHRTSRCSRCRAAAAAAPKDRLPDLFVMRGDERVCSVDQVSSGEIELLSFAGWIILNDFDDGLLVIDEPELHLHPQWQVTILPALRELAPNAQFLVASHADAVWDQAYSFERFLLVPETDPRSEAWRRDGGRAQQEE
ncbi:MAG TPA: AAA family ATPase, partial [Candidatus Nanopelagicales bacterium]|nr:AAA family ATPase [Candidatus Nanopelagicales bacterium]